MVGNQMPMQGYPVMQPQVFNWQQEMLNRLGSLQNQIQNSFPAQQMQMQQQPQPNQFLRGKQIGSREEVFAAPVDFEAQYFPCGNDTIFMKRLGMDGKSQILEFKLINEPTPQPVEQPQQIDYKTEFENIQKSFNIMNDRYNNLNNELNALKKEMSSQKNLIKRKENFTNE